jgi:hypothetical protein
MKYVLAATALILTGSAHASAWIDGTFAGMSYSSVGYQEIAFGKDLARGESFSQTFTYDLTLHNDGLQFPFGVDRSWQSDCSPFGNFTAQCSPHFTTYELAEFDFAFDVSQYGAQGIDYDVSGWPAGESVSAAPGQTVRFQGAFTITERNTLTDPMTPDPFVFNTMCIHTAAWIDSVEAAPAASVVPEAATITQVLCGLMMLAARWRRVR